MRKSLATAASVLGVTLAGAAAFAANSAVLNAEPAYQDIGTAAPVTFPASGMTPQLSDTNATVAVAGSGSSRNSLPTASASTTPQNNQPPAQSTRPSKTPPTTVASPVAPLAQVGSVQPAPSDTRIATYKVGNAGTVMLDSANQQLRIVNVIPASGWTARTAEASTREVKIYFSSSTQILEFEAEIEGTQVVVTVEDETVLSAPIPAAPRERHDDDDDEHEEHEEREAHDDDDD